VGRFLSVRGGVLALGLTGNYFYNKLWPLFDGSWVSTWSASRSLLIIHLWWPCTVFFSNPRTRLQFQPHPTRLGCYTVNTCHLSGTVRAGTMVRPSVGGFFYAKARCVPPQHSELYTALRGYIYVYIITNSLVSRVLLEVFDTYISGFIVLAGGDKP